MTRARVTALVATHDEADRIGATVRALCSIPEVDAVVVIDDGSVDATAGEASAAGALVLRRRHRVGKGRALEGALRRTSSAQVWLLADADLAESAADLGPVLREVLQGRADVAIALPPVQPGGGFGIVKRLAAGCVRALAGFRARAPLSGQRALTAEALAACRPLAAGFGVETAMTIDAARRGFRLAEVPAPVTHRATGRGPRGFAHRASQGVDILRAVVPRAVGLR